MVQCKGCNKIHPAQSHYGICAATFGTCIDCMIDSGELDESHMEQIYFLAGDIKPQNESPH